MPRYNPLLLKRPDGYEETVTVTDPLIPDAEITVTLRSRSDAIWRGTRVERQREYAVKYAIGDEKYVKTEGKEGEPPASLFGPYDFAEIPVTFGICSVIGSLSVMQEEALTHKYGDLKSVPADEAPYTFLEWAMIAERSGSAFTDIVEAADRIILRSEGKDDQGNALRAAKTKKEDTTPSLSEPPSGTG